MPNGVCVRGTMSLDALAQVFMVGWLSLSGVAYIACLAALRTPPFEPRSLSPLGMVIFGTALMTGGFLFEARQSLKPLNRFSTPRARS